ncbi:MAG: hypothetical protein HW416_1402 [Chloroflexi bacterium]|nr:hypothetical protein [Chloroflexota bacterium]
MNAAGAVRPSFIQALSEAHYAELCRCIILTGNIHDLFPVEADGVIRFESLRRSLQATLSQARYPHGGGTGSFMVAELAAGRLSFPNTDDALEIQRLATSLSASTSDSVLAGLGRRISRVVEGLPSTNDPSAAISATGELLRVVAGIRSHGIEVRPVAVLVEDADTLFPNREVASLSADDRGMLACLSDLLRDEEIWADAETAEVRPDFLILLSPTATEINRRILTLPKTLQIDIPLPDEGSRRGFIRQRTAAQSIAFEYPGSGDPAEAFVQDSRGLTIRALDDVITRAQRSGKAVGRASVVREVNGELQARLGSVIKIVYPDHSMQDVVGFRKLKLRLGRLERRIDNPERAPAGMCVIGPNGSGKTFICEAFAADTGRVVVTLSQIRSQWFGQTDVLSENFESALSVFGRILVLVDEAHVAFGSIHDPGTHETEARLARSIIQMMDNESARSNIFWALMTTRPDLLDPDVVRRGRCSLFVPIFDPEGEDAGDFISWMLDRFKRDGVSLSGSEAALLSERTERFSAGDYREFIGDFLEEREVDPALSLADFLDDWTPSAVSLAAERELQILLAALRCDWRELLPARLQSHSRDEIQREIDRLRLL